MNPALVVLAAGRSTRYGRPKALEPVGPAGEALLDYAIFDARRAGFGRVILVVRQELAEAMRAHLARRWGGVEARCALQATEAGRAKPWGTAHALLAAAEMLEGPFAVCNADDFYGARAFAALGAHLRTRPLVEQALVGYPIGTTLSAHGGVSRALCETNGTGLLRELTELREVREHGGGIRGVDVEGVECAVRDTALVSMNLWGFTLDVLPPLREGFAAFRAAHGGDPEAEYLLSAAVHDWVIAGGARLRVLAAGASWMGITHPADRDAVAARLARLVADGRYPSPLGEGS